MSKADYQVVEILDFSEEQVRQLLAGIRLPPSAYEGRSNKLKAWLCNPLLLSLVLRIKGTREWGRVCESRSCLYESWARRVTGQEAKKCKLSRESLLMFYKAAAIELLKKRKLAVPLKSLSAVMLKTARGRVLEAAQLDAMEILVPPGAKRNGERSVKFFHESAYEYFVAAALRGDFDKALQEDLREPGLRQLQLGKVELDYLQSSVHGFLSEMLGPGFPDALQNRLSQQNIRDMPEDLGKLLRNLVEFLGFMYRGDDDQKTAMFLLKLVKDARGRDDDAGLTVGFNAARALERIHPRAPRPYFDYASDWGERNWTKVYKDAEKEKIRPYAMRGVHRKTPKPGRKTLAVLRKKLTAADITLQQRVSQELADIIDELVDNPSEKRDESSLRINCSFAWVRWYHPCHKHRRASLQIKAENKGLEDKTIKNLTEWKKHEALRL